MLRYQLYEVNDARIPIEKELGYLKDYVDLQKMRKDENYWIEFNCSPEVKGFSIEPLLLIPFVENAFKHVSKHKHRLNWIKMTIEVDGLTLKMNIANSRAETTTGLRSERTAETASRRS